jgi:ABC-type iron transport system FetAB ATPase subunit
MSRFVIEGLRTKVGGPFSFAVADGECVALSGPSGCGKTLLLRALADLAPADGAVQIDGIERNEMTAPDWRRQVGWLPAEASWWFDLVGEHMSVDAMSPSRFTVGSERDGDIASTLEKLGFGEDVLNWRIDRLSTGEKQRLALFRLLLNRPKVLLLDEPTAALDVSTVWKVEELLKVYRKTNKASVVWVSHNAEQIARVADRHLELWKETA